MLFWMGAIFFVSHQPSEALPNYGIWDLLIKKSGHFLAYAILAVLVFRVTMGWQRPYLWAFVITAVYAMSDEFHQQFVVGRTPALGDVLIDCLGAATVLLLLYRSRNLRNLIQFNYNLSKNRITSAEAK